MTTLQAKVERTASLCAGCSVFSQKRSSGWSLFLYFCVAVCLRTLGCSLLSQLCLLGLTGTSFASSVGVSYLRFNRLFVLLRGDGEQVAAVCSSKHSNLDRYLSDILRAPGRHMSQPRYPATLATYSSALERSAGTAKRELDPAGLLI